MLMNKVQRILGILCAAALMITVLLTSVQIAVYSDMNFFEKEYVKHQVLDDVPMEMEDLMDVTKEMLDYLKGDREDLHVLTVISGESREFFNEREISHMEDVQQLFLYGFLLRRICILILLIGLLLLKFVCHGSIRKYFFGSFIGVTVVFAVLVGGLTLYLLQDFTQGFIYFHQLLFTNDFWILDSETDLLINIVPEPFFVDMAVRIGKIFGVSMLVLFIVSIIVRFPTRFTKFYANLRD